MENVKVLLLEKSGKKIRFDVEITGDVFCPILKDSKRKILKYDTGKIVIKKLKVIEIDFNERIIKLRCGY